MSEEKKVDVLQKFREQHHQFCLQRDAAQVNLQQLNGAIFAVELLMKQYVESSGQFVEVPIVGAPEAKQEGVVKNDNPKCKAKKKAA